MHSTVVLENLQYCYPPLRPGAEPVAALRGVDLAVDRGELLALTGPIGGGKSTICQAICGLVPHAWGGLFGGRVLVEGVDTRRVAPADLCRRVGIVFQDPETQLFNATVEAEVAFGPESLGLPRDEIGRRIDWALTTVHLAHLRQRSPRQLSGGQKQRLAIAAVLAMRPSILVLDEPTASLDPQGGREVMAVVDELRRAGDLTVVLVEQEAERIAERADRVALVVGGRIVAIGTPDEVYASEAARRRDLPVPQVLEVGSRLRAVEPDLPLATTLDAAVAALSARLCPTGAAPPSETPRAEASGAIAGPGPANDAPGRLAGSSPLAVELRDVWYEYEGTVEALRGVTLAVARGEKLAIVGQNGSGKTTLAKQLNGLLRPSRGRVVIEGQDVGHRPIGDLARRVGYVFQNPDHQIFAPSVWEELAFGPRQLGVPEEEVRDRVEEALQFFGLTSYRSDPPAALGFGLRRAVGLASVLTMRPSVLVLDEPFAGLDWTSTELALGWLRELAGRGHTVVLISHSMRTVAEFADRAAVLVGGELVFDGAPRDLFRRDDVLSRAGLVRPEVTELSYRLRACGLRPDCLTVDELVGEYRRVRAARAASGDHRSGDPRSGAPRSGDHRSQEESRGALR